MKKWTETFLIGLKNKLGIKNSIWFANLIRKSEKQTGMQKEKKKELKDFSPSYSCRFHPVNWWHEVGCPHKAWGNDDLQKALNMAKQSIAYLTYLLSEGKGGEK